MKKMSSIRIRHMDSSQSAFLFLCLVMPPTPTPLFRFPFTWCCPALSNKVYLNILLIKRDCFAKLGDLLPLECFLWCPLPLRVPGMWLLLLPITLKHYLRKLPAMERKAGWSSMLFICSWRGKEI